MLAATALAVSAGAVSDADEHSHRRASPSVSLLCAETSVNEKALLLRHSCCLSPSSPSPPAAPSPELLRSWKLPCRLWSGNLSFPPVSPPRCPPPGGSAPEGQTPGLGRMVRAARTRGPCSLPGPTQWLLNTLGQASHVSVLTWDITVALPSKRNPAKQPGLLGVLRCGQKEFPQTWAELGKLLGAQGPAKTASHCLLLAQGLREPVCSTPTWARPGHWLPACAAVGRTKQTWARAASDESTLGAGPCADGRHDHGHICEPGVGN